MYHSLHGRDVHNTLEQNVESGYGYGYGYGYGNFNKEIGLAENWK